MLGQLDVRDGHRVFEAAAGTGWNAALLAEGGSIAYLAVQRLPAPEPSFRAGAIGHGPNGASLAERLCRHVHTWGADRAARPSITIYPHSAPQTAGVQVIRREHCEMTVVY